MKNNCLTIIIQPDWGSSPKKLGSISSITFPKRVVYYLVLGTVLLVSFGVSGSWSIRENIAIENRIKSIQAKLNQINGIVTQVENIRKAERITREFLGIEAWDKNFDINKRMGKGGAESDEGFALPPLNIEQEIAEIDNNRPLHVRVHDLRRDVHELLLVLSKMTEKLKCRPTIMPVRDDGIWISSGFGWRRSPFTGLREFHKGLDISGRKGVSIISTADGVVKKIGYNRFIGYYVRIEHDSRFSTSYGHLWKYIVKKGHEVKRGQVIGYMGTSGMSTGYHLHYEVVDNARKVNPYNFILNRNEITLTASH
jgi:murein DD-endopeptidase MepM/ murein hydrolase activator NlpD